jgi:hypothetical protein
MNSQSRSTEKRNANQILVLALALWWFAGAALGAPPGGQLYYNQDCTQFFFGADIPAGRSGESIDRYVDEIADAGVTVFFCNTNSRRTNYRSQAWEAYWDGYDPAGPDDQPFLKPIPAAQAPAYRRGIGNMLQVHQEGVDYPARVIARCRQREMSPWISLRMNDCHDNDIPTHPFHGSFWVKNPQLRRQNCTGYFASCLDYARREVRDYFMALIVETLERYDVDGLELDFMREPYLFSADQEQEGAPILTAWLRDVRQRIDEAAAQRGHPIRLGVRAPSRPETAQRMGLDVDTWAKQGLIDLLVVTPRWATLEFGMGIAEWRRQLGQAKVTLVGGLEVLYRPIPGGPAELISPELAQGAAALVLEDGADAVYLFNYFPGTLAKPKYQNTLRAMTSLAAVREVPRTIGVTYRDIVAPGEAYQPPLPAKGKEARFAMQLGSEPPSDWRREVVIGVAADADTPPVRPLVFWDGKRCDFVEQTEANNGLSLMTFQIPTGPWSPTRTHEIKVASGDETLLTIQRVEVKLTP